MDWLANIYKMATFCGSGVEGINTGELGMEVIFRAASLELRLPTAPKYSAKN